MASIAHEYGIKLRKLYKRNRLDEGQQPKPGETLVLKGKKKKGEAPQIRLVSNRKRDKDSGDFMDDDKDERPRKEPKPVIINPRPKNQPADKPEVTTPTPKPKDPVPNVINVPPTSDALYIVKKGDTLYGIARRHGLTVAELKRLNDIVTNTIRPGQRMRVK